MNQPLYFEIYSLLQNYIYGVDAVLTADMELTLTVLATSCSVFVCAIPFLLVWKVLRML